MATMTTTNATTSTATAAIEADDDGAGKLCNGEPGCTDNEGVVWSWGGSGAIAAVSEAALAGFVVGIIPAPTNNGVPLPAVFFADAKPTDRSRRAGGDLAPFPFAVDAATGTITVAAGAQLDYETAPWVNFTVLIVEANPANPNKPAFSLSAALAVPIAPSGCVAGSTWSVTGTSPCATIGAACSPPLFQLAPPTPTSDRQCVLATNQSTTDTNTKISSDTVTIAAALLVTLVIVVVVIGLLFVRKRAKEEKEEKDVTVFKAVSMHAGTNPSLLVAAVPEYHEPGDAIHGNELDHDYVCFVGDDDGSPTSSEQVAYGAVAFVRGFGSNDSEVMYDAATLATSSNTRSSATSSVTYDVGQSRNRVEGIYDQATRVAGDNGLNSEDERRRDTEDDFYGLTFAGLEGYARDAHDLDESVYERAGSMPVGADAAPGEPIYDVGSTTDSGGTAEEPIYALGTTDSGGEGGWRRDTEDDFYGLAIAGLEGYARDAHDLDESVYERAGSMPVGADAAPGEPIYDVGSTTDSGRAAEKIDSFQTCTSEAMPESRTSPGLLCDSDSDDGTIYEVRSPTDRWLDSTNKYAPQSDRTSLADSRLLSSLPIAPTDNMVQSDTNYALGNIRYSFDLGASMLAESHGRANEQSQSAHPLLRGNAVIEAESEPELKMDPEESGLDAGSGGRGGLLGTSRMGSVDSAGAVVAAVTTGRASRIASGPLGSSDSAGSCGSRGARTSIV
jgi:hypothetical protein